MALGRLDKCGAMMVSRKLIANAEAAATFLTLMGNEKRLAIMSYLMEGEMSVGAIADKVQLSQSALSQHLAKLRAHELVQTRRDRQMIYYSCRSEAVRELLRTLDEIFGEQEDRQVVARLRRSGT
jgi:DNA-binding transcriptional ArsR family regulator